MPKYTLPRKFTLKDIPEYKRFEEANPEKELSEKSSNGMYCHAIHWMSILQILWPDFEHRDHYEIDAAYLVPNDPDEDQLPEGWFSQMAKTIAMFWRIQLEDLYPNGKWEILIDEKRNEVYADIYNRG
jgi:hypothetical protein